MSARPSVLLVEDQEDDVLIAQRCFSRADIDVSLHVTRNAAQTLELLQRDDSPDLAFALIDLNLPGINGIELVEEVRRLPRVGLTPMMIFSSSDDPRDVRRAYAVGCNGYVRKPISSADFRTTIAVLEAFWLQVAILPDSPLESRSLTG